MESSAVLELLSKTTKMPTAKSPGGSLASYMVNLEPAWLAVIDDGIGCEGMLLLYGASRAACLAGPAPPIPEGGTSVRHQYRQCHRLEDGPCDAPQHPLPCTTVSVAAHDQQVRSEVGGEGQ